jgi:hypothetical protein
MSEVRSVTHVFELDTHYRGGESVRRDVRQAVDAFRTGKCCPLNK